MATASDRAECTGLSLDRKAVLTEARRLVSEGWTRRTYARDDCGHDVGCKSPKAKFFCAIGAIRRAGGDDSLLIYFRDMLEIQSIFMWNGTSTKEQVLQGFDKVILTL